MALQSAPPTLGLLRTPAHGLLLLLLSLGWVQLSWAQTADSGQGVMTPRLQRTSQDLSWQQSEPTVILPRALQGTEKKACPPGKEVHVVDENLVFYTEQELEACVDGALLAEHMDRVNAIPFTYQQLDILKHKLDQVYPQGYPESLIQHLSYFFLEVAPEDIHKWNLTSLETVKSLLKISTGRKMDAQVAALIARYVAGGGQLDKVTLDLLASFHPAYLCSLSPEQLAYVQQDVVWVVRPQDLDACRPLQMDVLYHKARVAFQNMSGSAYFAKIKPFLEHKHGRGHIQEAEERGLAAADHCRGARTSGSKPGGPEGRGGDQPGAGLDLAAAAERPGQPGAGAPRWHPQRLPGPRPQRSRGPLGGLPPPWTWVCVHCDPSSAPGFAAELSTLLWMLNGALLWRFLLVGAAWVVPAPSRGVGAQ